MARFGLIDWILIIMPLALVLVGALFFQRYVKSIAQFLSGGRVAGRYLVCVAGGQASFAAVTAVATFEIWKAAGLSNNVWGALFGPVTTVLALTGFIVCRFRETRCMTLAEFFERRYSRNFRLFSGVIIFLAGVVSYGIFPGVSARFFVYFAGFPPEFHLLGLQIPTFWLVMAFGYSIVLLVTLSGGQTSMMAFHCLSGIFSQCCYLIIIVALVLATGWWRIGEVLTSGGVGHSLIDPFDNYAISDFGVWYVVMSVIVSIYAYGAWQGTQGYNSSALSAHEAKMGGILGTWRNQGHYTMYGLLALCAAAFLQHHDFSVQIQHVGSEIAQISSATERNQMQFPIALRYLLPHGVLGILFAVMFFSYIGFDCSLLHSWGGVFVQDIILPLRDEKPLSPAEHMKWLRLAILGVAIFGFVFSVTVKISDFVFMFQQITMSIYLGGAGAVIIGGLYWRRGTAGAAWTAMLVGSSLSAISILAQQVWVRAHQSLEHLFAPTSWMGHLLAAHPERFPINGQVITLAIMGLSLALYVLVSLFSKDQPCDMNALLHRSPIPTADEKKEESRGSLFIRALRQLTGVDEHFTRSDKIIAHSVFWYNMLWSIVSLLLLVAFVTRIGRLGRNEWFMFSSIAYFGIPATIALVTTVWFTWGGIIDLRKYWHAMRTYVPDATDDGTVHTQAPTHDSPLAPNGSATDAESANSKIS